MSAWKIHGYSQMLLDVTEEELRDPSYLKTLIEGVVKGSERMKGVVDLMFDVTEADVGDMKLFKGHVSLEDVIDQATQSFLPALDERRIAFGKVGIQDLPVVEADGTRLVQAFENLISNAIKYSPSGSAVRIETRNNSGCVRISVIDQGEGIPENERPLLFQPFSRLSTRPTAGEHSTGLGLWIVKQLVALHGGEVGLDCPSEGGSNFWVDLPLVAEE